MVQYTQISVAGSPQMLQAKVTGLGSVILDVSLIVAGAKPDGAQAQAEPEWW